MWVNKIRQLSNNQITRNQFIKKKYKKVYKKNKKRIFAGQYNPSTF